MKKQLLIRPGKDDIIDVGFRPWLVSEALNYNVKCFPRNVPCSAEEAERKCVRVILEGVTEDVESFVKDLIEKRIKHPEISDYTLSNNKAPVNEEIDWSYNAAALTCNQMSTFVSEAKELRKEVRDGFASMSGSITDMNGSITGMSGSITDMRGSINQMNTNITTLASDMRDGFSKMSGSVTSLVETLKKK